MVLGRTEVLNSPLRLFGLRSSPADRPAQGRRLPDYDERLGIAGMHTVRPAVTFESRQTVLPPDLFEQYSRLSFWNDPTGRCSVLRVAQP